MPNRIIRDSARTSPTLDALSDGAERCFWRLTTAADDYGRFLADPRAVLSACFPLKVGGLPVKRVAAWLEEMGAVKLVLFYRVGDRLYGQFVSADKYFDKRARTSKYPDPVDASICAHVLARCQQMPASTEAFESSEAHESSEARGTDDTPKPARLTAPALGNGHFKIPGSVLHALGRAPRLGAVASLRSSVWWQAEIRANPGVELDHEILKAEAYLTAHPEKRYKKLSTFLHNWLGRADRPQEAG